MEHWSVNPVGSRLPAQQATRLKTIDQLRYKEDLDHQLASKRQGTPKSFPKKPLPSLQSYTNDLPQVRLRDRKINQALAAELLSSQHYKLSKLQAQKEHDLLEDKKRNAAIEHRRQLDLKLQKQQKSYLQSIAEQNMRQAEHKKEVQLMHKVKEQVEELYTLEAMMTLQGEQRKINELYLQDQRATRAKSFSPPPTFPNREAERRKLQESFEVHTDHNRLPEHLARKLEQKSAADNMRLSLDRQILEKQEQKMQLINEKAMERQRLQREEELFKKHLMQHQLEKFQTQRELYGASALR